MTSVVIMEHVSIGAVGPKAKCGGKIKMDAMESIQQIDKRSD